MSSRRHLVNRSNRPSAVNDTPAHRQDARRSAAVLPTYQPLQCPLTAKAKRDLENLGSNVDDDKYKKSLEDAFKFLSSAVEDTSEMLDDQKKKLQQLVRRREKDNGEKTEFEEKVEENINQIEEKLKKYMAEGEKAVRELIDYDFQHKEYPAILRSVVDNIASAPAPAARERTNRRRRSRDSDNADDENDDSEESDPEDQSAPALKPSELLKQKQNESRALYEATSLLDRYADSNDYIGFKTISHIAKHGEDAPVPAKRDWFRDDGDDSPEPEQANNGDNSDDDLVLQSATVNTKCPLSMMDLTEPYSNKKCIHVYEKKSLLEYIQTTGIQYSTGKRGQLGPRQVKCVVPGCEVMIAAEDCFTDPLVARRVKKALAEAKRLEEEEDSEDDEDAIPGTQRSRPAAIDDDEDEEDDREHQRRRTITRVKAERMSRGVSVGPPHAAGEAEEETGELEDEDEMDEDTGFSADQEV